MQPLNCYKKEFLFMKTTSTSKEFTKNCIMDALLQLMQTQDYNSISITDLTSRAGVSRMSYYRHYKCKDDILMDYMYRIVKEYAEELQGPSFLSDFQSYEHILYSLKYLQKYKDYVLCLKKANRAEILLKGLDLYMISVTAAQQSTSLDKYRLYYYSGALYNLFMHWIEDGMEERPETIASLVYDQVKNHRFPDKKS